LVQPGAYFREQKRPSSRRLEKISRADEKIESRIFGLVQRQPVQYFHTPPDEVCADRYTQRDLDQLYDELNLRHRR
jgi:hypothetical protein